MPSSLILLKDEKIPLLKVLSKISFINEYMIAAILIIKYVGIIYFLYFFNLPVEDKFLFSIVNLFKKDIIYNLCNLLKKISSIKVLKDSYYFIYILLLESMFLTLVLILTLFMFKDKENIYILGIIYLIGFFLDNLTYWFVIKNLF